MFGNGKKTPKITYIRFELTLFKKARAAFGWGISSVGYFEWLKFMS